MRSMLMITAAAMTFVVIAGIAAAGFGGAPALLQFVEDNLLLVLLATVSLALLAGWRAAKWSRDGGREP